MYGLGRNQVLTWDGEEIAGVKTKTVTVNGEAVDITDDDSNGWREVYEDAGTLGVELSIEGYAKDWRLQEVAFSVEDRIDAVVLTGDNGAVLSGDFYLQDYEQGMEHDGFTSFSATLLSNGEISYSAGSS